MAHPKPHLLSERELRRHEDCADENAKLADCWNGEQVVIISLDWSDADKHPGYTLYPTLEIDVMTPAEKPVWGLEEKRNSTTTAAQPARQLCKRTIRMLERTKEHKRLRPKPFYMKSDTREHIDLYSDDAQAKARETFNDLSTAFMSVCIATLDVRETERTLGMFGVKQLPANVVFVDLIKVLEHQTRDEGIPEKLRRYTDDNVAVRNGRYDCRPGTLAGPFGMPCVRMLEVLGPAAESRRRDFKKEAKGDAALKRIARRERHSGDGRKGKSAS